MTRALGWLDTFLHWSLDWYINRTMLGWGHLQLWQNNVCNAYEHRVETRPTPPAEHVNLSGWTDAGWVNKCSCGWYDAQRAACWDEHLNSVTPPEQSSS